MLVTCTVLMVQAMLPMLVVLILVVLVVKVVVLVVTVVAVVLIIIVVVAAIIVDERLLVTSDKPRSCAKVRAYMDPSLYAQNRMKPTSKSCSLGFRLKIAISSYSNSSLKHGLAIRADRWQICTPNSEQSEWAGKKLMRGVDVLS